MVAGHVEARTTATAGSAAGEGKSSESSGWHHDTPLFSHPAPCVKAAQAKAAGGAPTALTTEALMDVQGIDFVNDFADARSGDEEVRLVPNNGGGGDDGGGGWDGVGGWGHGGGGATQADDGNGGASATGGGHAQSTAAYMAALSKNFQRIPDSVWPNGRNPHRQ